ncbi:hypothetical protein E2C01_098235 [Portunus trituberculatus]|uniref:Uncharacterized protein n=1 Tax=Portunus trituberculatus TaxID=210409 RepID=A0A5B7KCE5_PORTR|nr:hypothetical protein [Portunus trituberculatus]
MEIQKQGGSSRVYCGTVEPCVLWGPRGLQAHGFESCPWSERRLGFLTRDNGFLAAHGSVKGECLRSHHPSTPFRGVVYPHPLPSEAC